MKSTALAFLILVFLQSHPLLGQASCSSPLPSRDREPVRVACAFVKMDASKDWAGCYKLLASNAQKLWDIENYAKYLSGLTQVVCITDPKPIFVSKRAGNPTMAFVHINSFSIPSRNAYVLLVLENNDWRVVLAEPLISGELGQRGLQELLRTR